MNKLITALPTPYLNGKIDLRSYVKLLSFQLENGADALLALGTTAETQLLDVCEQKLLVTVARKTTDGNVPLYVGVEEANTAKAVKKAVWAENLGADALLIAPPAFCKCTPQGYYEHISAILNAVSIPLILYNIPSRAGYSLDVTAVKRLAGKVPFVKDASANTDFTEKLRNDFTVFCGNDELLAQYLDKGAKGVISVVSNVAPKLTRAVLNGEESELFTELAKLTMREVNPVPIKYMLKKADLFDGYGARLPLTAASEETRRDIDEFWEKHKAEIR